MVLLKLILGLGIDRVPDCSSLCLLFTCDHKHTHMNLSDLHRHILIWKPHPGWDVHHGTIYNHKYNPPYYIFPWNITQWNDRSGREIFHMPQSTTDLQVWGMVSKLTLWSTVCSKSSYIQGRAGRCTVFEGKYGNAQRYAFYNTIINDIPLSFIKQI